MNFFSKKVCIKEELLRIFAPLISESSSVGRAPAFQAGCREFEPRLPLHKKALQLQGFFYFNSFSSVSGATSIGVSFLLKILAVKVPFNFTESPLTSNQLPSLNPTTGCGLKW